MSEFLSPAAVVETLGKAGVQISERELRAKARRIGCYREVGRAIFFTPADLDKLFAPEEPCSNSSSGRTRHTGLRGAPSTVAASSEALAKVTRLRRNAR